MHIDGTSRQYVTAAGERPITRRLLPRRSYRDENGRPRNETLANLSALPNNAIAALRLALKGAALVDAESTFDVERSVPHGDVTAAHVMAEKLGLRPLLGPGEGYRLCPGRVPGGAAEIEIVDGPQVGRGHEPGVRSRDFRGLCGVRVRGNGLAPGAEEGIEGKLARKHLRDGRMAMYDLSSSWVDEEKCELADFGYSRDGKRGKQVEYGLMTDPEGRPVGIDVFRGNTSDAESFKTAIGKARSDFGLKDIVFVGDCGMIRSRKPASRNCGN